MQNVSHTLWIGTADIKDLSIFLAIKMIAKMSRKHKEEEAAAPAEPSATEKLLAEIRDELKKK